MDSEREKLRKRIIEGMCLTSSIYGLAANYVKGNSEDEEQFLKECYGQKKHKSFMQHLGEDLYYDLVNYYENYCNV